MQIVREHKIMDATAYLLEKAGDVQGAFEILLNNLLDTIQLFMDGVQKKTKSEEGNV